MNTKQKFAALIAAAGLATAGSVVWAQTAASAPTQPAQSIQAQGRITMEQAIAAAEQNHPGGKATKAELDHEWGKAVYEGEVKMPNRQEYDVKVDASTGKIISSRLDHDD